MPSLLERPVLPPRWSTPTLPQSYRSIQNKDYEQSSPVTTPTTPCYPAGLRCPPRTSLSAPTTSRLPSIDVGIETILNRHRDRTPVALLPSYNASSPSISMQNTVSQDAPTHHIGSYAPIPPAPLTSIRPSSGPWNPSDDQTLIAARAKGMNWAPIQQAYFPSKTPNACRKRHERLMERRSADDWDGFKLENLAKNYMAMRREIWSGVAAQMGEKWNYVEQKCMSQGLKNLQQAARSCARRERMLQSATEQIGMYNPDRANDSGIGLDETELETEYKADCGSNRGNSPTPSLGLLRLPSMDMGINAIINRPVDGRAIKVAAKIQTDEAAEAPYVPDPKIPHQNDTDLQHVPENEESSEAQLSAFEGLLGASDASIGTTESPYQSMAGCLSTLRSFSDAKAHSNYRDLSKASNEDANSVDNSLGDIDMEYRDKSSNLESAPGVTQHYSMLLALTSVLRRGVLHRIMLEFNRQVGKGSISSFAASGESSKGEALTGDEQQATSSAIFSEHGGSSRSTISPGEKRQADDDADNDQNDKRDRKRQRKDPLKSGRAIAGRRKLPCPYHRHDPECFGLESGFDVCRRDWPDIAKLKEHLYRRHYNEFQCQRCKVNFNSRIQLDRHAESPSACHPLARELKDGFTFETYDILHNKKKSFPGQDEEDKWREIYFLLFPSAGSIPEPVGPHSDITPGDTALVKENLSLEEFGNFALPQEFKRRAMTLVNDTMRPLEMDLFNQIPSIIQDSQETVSQRYQQLLETSSSDLNPMQGCFITPSSNIGDSFRTIPGIQNTAESNTSNFMYGQWTQPGPFGLDRFQDLWAPLEGSNRVTNGHNSPDSGFNSSLSCSCIGGCTCPAVTDRQPRTPQLNQARETPCPPSESSIMAFLQTIKGSISVLERSLHVGSSTR